ncbi:unnamed protein product [Zymoseptoria tritici ST99CH_3D7]|uniref:Enoyl-CoA hydratase n=1 Tax=Zymoseptoria tritici (strain ST99CH_3D7) TaxID=1276538 RepID=A0A1X7S8J8_ZYMT9|nr:unnamed protein product [Zymoseptoria tritici ST99CH_3D7]
MEPPRVADTKMADAVTKSKRTSATSLKSPREWQPTDLTSEDVRVERAGSAVKITLARAKKGNSMTPSMLSSLTALYRDLATDPTVFTITLAGDGKFSCTGMDFSEDTDRSSAEGNFYRKVRDLFKAIEDVPQTTIALIAGPAFGSGVGLTFACDVRIVASTARWTLSEVKLGLQPAVLSRFMSREWGFSCTREAMLSGPEASPAELHRIGAVHQVVDDPSTLPQALDKYLDVLDQCAPKSDGEIKELIRLAWKDAGDEKQDAFIEEKVLKMMTPGSEDEHGISQFEKKIRPVDWKAFWAPKSKF